MSTAPLIGVLALQGDVREHVHSLEAVGARTREVRVPEELAGLDGIVLPGGESTTMSHLLERQGLFTPLSDAIAAGLPAYGSCAGLILLAATIVDPRAGQRRLAAIDMTVQRNAFGSQVDSFETDLVIPVLGTSPVRAVFIRAPWVESVGPEVEVLGRIATESGADRIVAVRQGRCLATSFHPELTGDTRVHEFFVNLVRQA